ncbi:MAG: hypothetical protein N2485_01580 [bacterium]|nr:hypothetical protein [bacterium]
MGFEDRKEKKEKNPMELRVSLDKQDVKTNFIEVDYSYVSRVLALLSVSSCFLTYFLFAFFAYDLIFFCKIFFAIIPTFIVLISSINSVYVYLKYRNKDFKKAKEILSYVFFSLLSLGFICALWVALFWFPY